MDGKKQKGYGAAELDLAELAVPAGESCVERKLPLRQGNRELLTHVHVTVRSVWLQGYDGVARADGASEISDVISDLSLHSAGRASDDGGAPQLPRVAEDGGSGSGGEDPLAYQRDLEGFCDEAAAGSVGSGAAGVESKAEVALRARVAALEAELAAERDAAEEARAALAAREADAEVLSETPADSSGSSFVIRTPGGPPQAAGPEMDLAQRLAAIEAERGELAVEVSVLRREAHALREQLALAQEGGEGNRAWDSGREEELAAALKEEASRQEAAEKDAAVLKDVQEELVGLRRRAASVPELEVRLQEVQADVETLAEVEGRLAVALVERAQAEFERDAAKLEHKRCRAALAKWKQRAVSLAKELTLLEVSLAQHQTRR